MGLCEVQIGYGETKALFDILARRYFRPSNLGHGGCLVYFICASYSPLHVTYIFHRLSPSTKILAQ